MAAKKRGGKKAKKVTITIDEATLQALVDAAHALSKLAAATVVHCDDPPTKKRLTKRAKR